MRSLFEAGARDAITDRLRTLTPESPRQWGRLRGDEMLCHLADQLRMALGGIPTAAPAGPLRYRPIRYLMIHVLPWPKGRAKGPAEAFTTAPADWENDREQVIELVREFGGRSPSGDWPSNPIFGSLSGHDWGVLSYRHLDHHLRQFGA